jgi:hypothetical protein
MNHARPLITTTKQYPNLSTKTELIAFRLNENTLKAIDSYCTAFNMNRNNVIEFMIHIFVRYAALTKQERRSQQ